MFLELPQLKLYLKYFGKYASKITSTLPMSAWSHHARTFYDLLSDFAWHRISPIFQIILPRNIYNKNSPMYSASSIVPYVSHSHHLCFISVFFTTTTSRPKIHMLLKSPQLNWSDTIMHAHSTTFSHVFSIIRSIFF